MSSKKNVVASALAAVGLAVVILMAAGFAGMLPFSPNGGNPNSTGNGGVSPGPLAGRGTLSILATDPPQLPDGVTGVQITYDSISVHSAQISSAAGWIELNATGTIDSMALINVGQTLVSAQVPVGTYDFLRIHITSVKVTYNGSTYGATVANDLLTVAMDGGMLVNSTKSGAALVDLEPTVLNSGSSSSPQFVFNTVLQVYPIDPINFSSSMQISGSRVNLTSTPLMPSAAALSAPTLNIAQASLGVSSVSVTVKNAGDATQSIRLVIVKPIPPTAVPRANVTYYPLPALANSIVFAVQPDGTLKLLSQGTVAFLANATSVFQGSGFSLLSGSSVTFSYVGTLTLGNQTLTPMMYQITVISDTAQATFTLPLG